MKNHREVLGIAVNVVLVLVLLLFIVIGLNKIGVYDLPDRVEKLIGTYKEPQDVSIKSNSGLDESIEYNDKKTVVTPVSELTYENARSLIEEIEAVKSYRHEMTAEYYDESQVALLQNISFESDNGISHAVVTDGAGNSLKTVSENDGIISVTMFSDGNESVITYPKSNFDITDECGFIITADNFLSSDYELDEASFYLENGTYGSELTITFETVMGDYSQTEVYTLSVDYGVVVYAECYENDKLIYTLKTKSLSHLND
ncbi:MAG: hypothetical protein E7600_04425 [Ruminococcaceae bacterium]|nr:hypothetical protein [Oscillospiraceae bacterium]